MDTEKSVLWFACIALAVITVANLAVCWQQKGRIIQLERVLQSDRTLIQSLYEQIATTEVACDMAIEEAQNSCVD